VTDDARHRETFGCELKSGTTRLPRSRRADKSGYGKREEATTTATAVMVVVAAAAAADAAQSSLIRVAAAVAAGY